MARRPWVRSHRLAVVLGLAAFVAGALLLYDAYERRGLATPRPLRPFTFW